MNRGLASLVLCGLALSGLPAAGAQENANPLRVEYAGCATVLEGPVCLLASHAPLTLWVRADPGASFELSNDAATMAVQPDAEIQAGHRFEFTPDPDTGFIRVTASVRGAEKRSWTLTLRHDAKPAYLREVQTAGVEGRLDDARKILETALAAPQVERRGTAMGLLARLYRAQGEDARGEQLQRRAIDLNLAEGFRFDALKDATALAFALVHGQRDFAAANAVLDRVAQPWDGPAEGAYFLDHFRGLVAYNAGDSRQALRFLGQARDRAQRMGWETRTLVSEAMLAVQLRNLGRGEEARGLLAPWRHRRPEGMWQCEFADVLTNIGWIELLALEAGEPASDPTPVLEEALNLFREKCSAQDRVNGLVNLALARLHAGDLKRASRYLAAAREATEKPELRMVLWADDIEARIALQQGRVQEAVEAFAALEELAGSTLSPGARWRATVGKARALSLAGDAEGALATYAAADRSLDDALYQVPFDQGRERLVATRAWAAAHHLDLLLATGRVDEAFALTRKAGKRMLQTLRPFSALDGLAPAQRARWDAALASYQALHEELVSTANLAWLVPADVRKRMAVVREEKEQELRVLLDEALSALGPVSPVLPELGADALTLAFHPLPEGWAGFAYNGVRVQVQRVRCESDGDAARLALCLLKPFAAALETADRLRVLSTGPLRGVDFHALAWRDGVLLDLGPVVYSLDLPGERAARGSPGQATGSALLVADPRGDLALGQREVQRVAGLLTSDGRWQFDLLEGMDADSASLRARLSGASLFHFAGHARFAGSGGWDSELLLADQAVFDVADIIALPSVPQFVVLSGCETAASSGDPTPDSIGLAHAFLTSGSGAVLAATRPVDDSLAYRFMEHFYVEYLASGDAAGALRSVQLFLRAEDAALDWSAFRLLER